MSNSASTQTKPRQEGTPDVRVRDLLWGRWRSLRNTPFSEGGGRLRIVLLLSLGAFVWFGIYGASSWFTGKTLELDYFGGLMMKKMLGLAITAFGGMLLFSNIIAAFSHFLLTDELAFLMARPLPPNRFFASRFIESSTDASWMAAIFILPVLLGVGSAFSAPLMYYLLIPVVLLPLMIICSALAVPFVLILASLFPIYRTRMALGTLGIGALVGLFIFIRSMEPERLLSPDKEKFASTLELFGNLQAPGAYWLPPSWAGDLLTFQLGEQSIVAINTPPTTLYLTCLFSCAAGCYFLAAWSFRALHSRAYSRSQQGRPEAALDGSEESIDQKRAIEVLDRSVAKFSKREGPTSPVRGIALKDSIIFTRDVAQWSQLLLLLSLVTIYLVNFSYIGDLADGTGVFGPVGIYFLNIALSSFMVTAVSVRLVFPAISLEGKAFWLVRRAPVGLKSYLFAKWVGHTPILFILAEGLVLSSNLMIGTEPWLIGKSIVVVGILAVATSGLGIGLGSLFPRFHIDNAAKIATGLGGVLFMFLSLSMTFVVMILDAYPTYYLMRHTLNPNFALPDAFWIKSGAAWFGILLVCLLASVGSILLGARKLDQT